MSKQVVLTVAFFCYKTLFPYIMGETSPILFKRNFYTTYKVGENSPVTFTQWKFYSFDFVAISQQQQQILPTYLICHHLSENKYC